MTVTSKPMWDNGVFQPLSDALWLGMKDTSKGRMLGRPSIKLGVSRRIIDGESTRWHCGKSSLNWVRR